MGGGQDAVQQRVDDDSRLATGGGTDHRVGDGEDQAANQVGRLLGGSRSRSASAPMSGGAAVRRALSARRLAPARSARGPRARVVGRRAVAPRVRTGRSRGASGAERISTACSSRVLEVERGVDLGRARGRSARMSKASLDDGVDQLRPCWGTPGRWCPPRSRRPRRSAGCSPLGRTAAATARSPPGWRRAVRRRAGGWRGPRASVMSEHSLSKSERLEIMSSTIATCGR